MVVLGEWLFLLREVPLHLSCGGLTCPGAWWS